MKEEQSRAAHETTTASPGNASEDVADQAGSVAKVPPREHENIATPGSADQQEAVPDRNQNMTATPANALYRLETSNPDSLLSYAYDKDLAVSEGNGYLNASSDLNQIKDLDEFTLNLNFHTSKRGIQTLFYVGSDQPNTQNQYFNVYISSNAVGIEIRDGSLNPGISAAVSVENGREHVLTMSFKRHKYYRIYVDGGLVLNDTDSSDTARFLDSLALAGGPDTMTFGKGTRSEGNDYPFTGTIKKIDLFAEALPENEIMHMHGVVDALEEGTVISEHELPVFTGTNQMALSDQLPYIADLEQGSINVRYRVSDFNNTSNGNMALFSVSNQKANGTYGIFFVNPKADQIGIYMTSGGTEYLNMTVDVPNGVTIKDKEWHTASFVVNKKQGSCQLYVDDQLCGNGPAHGFLNRLTGADTALAGGLSAKGGKHSWDLKGNVDLLEVYANPLSKGNVDTLHEMTRRVVETPLPDTAVKSDPVSLFYSGYDGSAGYRIPSLLTTKNGVTIAAVDKRNQHTSDYGNIDTVIRRSTDSGETWGKPDVILNLPSGGEDLSAYNIDSSMVEDKETGTIHLLVDMFPESGGLVKSWMLKPGTGYLDIDGTKYLELRDYYHTNSGNDLNKPHTDKVYIVKEDGYVYQVGQNDVLTKSEYSIPNVADGSLFKGEEKTPAGNIYIYTGSDQGDLTVLRTSYLWMISSDDDGLTWSKPMDLTPMVKESWMLFLGTGPGQGIQIEHGEHAGRLVFPVYFSNINVGGSQASAVIYSDDHGKTWKRGESPVKLRGIEDLEHMNNDSLILTESQVTEAGTEGRLKIFMRNYGGQVSTATSDDGGASWKNYKKDPNLFDSYCQLTVIKYRNPLMYDGVMQDAYVFANPARSGRNDGTVKIGFYDGARDEFIWPYHQLIHKDKYQYSCLTNLPDQQIGLLYEGDVPNIRFTKFSPDWVTTPRSSVVGAPSITGVQMKQDGRKLTFTVDFDMDMLKVGTPVLDLEVDGKVFQAAYESGTSSKQYVFTYDLKDDKLHKITAVNVAGEEGSSIGNIRNQLPENVRYEFSVGTDQPIVPDKPVAPDQPIVPDKPVAPDQPIVPDKPVAPDCSSDSGSSADVITKTPASTGSSRDWVRDEKGWKMSGRNGGAIRDEWKQVNQIWYYLGKDGYMKTGWQQLDGTWYYLDPAGEMKTGWQQLDGTWYYMSGNGAMAVNTVIDGYALDESGALRK